MEKEEIETLIELHKHLDICGHNIKSSLKEKLREMISKGATPHPPRQREVVWPTNDERREWETNFSKDEERYPETEDVIEWLKYRMQPSSTSPRK